MDTTAILDQLKKDRIAELLSQGKRIDGRAFDEHRELKIETGVVPKANGSARVHLGDTDVVCGVKIQPDRPFPDMGDKGIFICTAELLPFSHPSVETGPPGEAVIELARVVDRGVRESKMIDMSQFVIKKNKSVVGIFADNTVLDYDGNLFDACSYAATAAILSAKSPKWEFVDDGPVLVEGEESELPITTIPVSVTVGRIGEHIIADPSGEEWDCLDARITITTNSDGNICALQKGGTDGFTAEDLIKCGGIAISSGSRIREIIKRVKE
jgi:exosome complex component RRP42